MKKLLLAAVTLFAAHMNAQLSINDSLTISQLTTLLQGSGVTVSGVTVNCPAVAMGEFTGTSEMAITHGIVLTTGHAEAVADSASRWLSNINNVPGDADLEASAFTFNTHDACAVSFDCTPTGDTLLFNFSFGSEEYPEFVSASFNDVFAILMSGPGIAGQRNVARLPNSLLVSIDNVNAVSNSTYFYDNLSPVGQYVAYDGFTTNLTAFAQVTPGSVYHFKVVIADEGDYSYDSGVFIEAFSFRSVVPSGIEEEETSQLSVYPNPGTGVYTLRDTHNTYNGSMLTVTNVFGETVFARQISEASTIIDLTNDAGGVYFIHVNSPSGQITRKLIKN